jgi:transposase-like protein
MDERAQQRKIKHRLAVIRHAEEITGNVAMTCRYYGVSRPCFYKWLHRYEEFGEEGLRDGSSRPLNSPKATKAEVVGKIIYLRQNDHFGPQKISMYLKRYHDVTVSPSGVWLDEIGFAPMDHTGAQLFFRLVAAAYERRSLRVASHWPFEDWGRFLPDHSTAVSLLDRLLHHNVLVVTEGESFRMKEAREGRKT